jgi:hypothetical protein
MRFYKKQNKKYISVSEIIGLGVGNKDWNWIKQQYELTRYKGSWCTEEQTELGTIIHKFVDKIIKGFIACPEWLNDIFDYQKQISEVPLFHDKLGYAGTADIICKTNNKIKIFDIKTVVFTDITDHDYAKFNKKIKNKVNKTLVQLVAYGLVIENLDSLAEVSYGIKIYDPLDKGLIVNYEYTEKDVIKAKAKFQKYYDFAVELGYIEQ